MQRLARLANSTDPKTPEEYMAMLEEHIAIVTAVASFNSSTGTPRRPVAETSCVWLLRVSSVQT
jgi:hypothetical protein